MKIFLCITVALLSTSCAYYRQEMQKQAMLDAFYGADQAFSDLPFGQYHVPCQTPKCMSDETSNK